MIRYNTETQLKQKVVFLLISPQADEEEWGGRMPVRPHYQLISTENRLVSQFVDRPLSSQL